MKEKENVQEGRVLSGDVPSDAFVSILEEVPAFSPDSKPNQRSWRRSVPALSPFLFRKPRSPLPNPDQKHAARNLLLTASQQRLFPFDSRHLRTALQSEDFDLLCGLFLQLGANCALLKQSLEKSVTSPADEMPNEETDLSKKPRASSVLGLGSVPSCFSPQTINVQHNGEQDRESKASTLKSPPRSVLNTLSQVSISSKKLKKKVASLAHSTNEKRTKTAATRLVIPADETETKEIDPGLHDFDELEALPKAGSSIFDEELETQWGKYLGSNSEYRSISRNELPTKYKKSKPDKKMDYVRSSVFDRLYEKRTYSKRKLQPPAFYWVASNNKNQDSYEDETEYQPISKIIASWMSSLRNNKTDLQKKSK